jgi:hypothetical protein
LLALAPREAGRTVVGIPSGGEQPNDRRYAIVVPGERGILVSSSTRIPGLVSISDVARPGTLAVERRADPVGYLEALDRRIRENGRARAPAAALVAAVLIVLALAAPRAAVLGFSTVVAANLLLGLAGVSSPWVVAVSLGVATAAAWPLARAVRTEVALGAVSAGVVAAYGLAMAVDSTWVALSPFGPSQNGRFYGLSNLLATLLLVPALAAAAIAFRRFGRTGFAAVAALSVVVVASSRLGADAGGAIVLAAGYAVLAGALLPTGSRARVAALVAAGTVLAAAAALAVGPSTHVTEALTGGPADLLDALRDRLRVSWLRATERWETGLAVGASLAAVAALVARGPRQPLAVAFAAAIGISMLVNDSPREVAIGGLAGYLALSRSSGRA